MRAGARRIEDGEAHRGAARVEDGDPWCEARSGRRNWTNVAARFYRPDWLTSDNCADIGGEGA